MKRKSNFVILEDQQEIRKSKRIEARQIQEAKSHFNDLPDCIIFDILLRLPMKWVLLCRCVCKSWCTLISNSKFAELRLKRAETEVLIRTNDSKHVSRTLHLLDFEPRRFQSDNFVSKDDYFCSCGTSSKLDCKSHMTLQTRFKLPLRDDNLELDKRIEARLGGSKRSYIACKPNNDKFDVVNSCNGLLCLCHPRNKNPLAVCNPITGEFIRLPNPLVKERVPIHCVFGFHPLTNEYKVIRMYRKFTRVSNYGGEMRWFAEMHTLGNKIWKAIGPPSKFLFQFKFPTCVDGSPHWLAHHTNLECMILSFNFEREKFQYLPFPPPLIKHKYITIQNVSIGELRGCLYICDGSSGDVNLCLMKEYGVRESWTMLFSINTLNESAGWLHSLYWPIKFFENDGILIYKCCSNYLLYYEPGQRDFKLFKVREIQRKFEAISIVPSLISLKNIVKGENIEVLNIHSRCGAFKLHEEKQVLSLIEDNVEKASLRFSSKEQN